jgi:chorismate mutase / prephenate dehydratase
MIEKIDELRMQINDLDLEVLELLVRRKGISQKVVNTKVKLGLPVRDSVRERELLRERVKAGADLGLDSQFVNRVFREIIEDSVRTQNDFLVALSSPLATNNSVVGYQGGLGSYCQLAAQQFFSGRQVSPVFQGFTKYVELISAVKDGRIALAFLPVENSSRGVIKELVDVLVESQLSIVGEELYKVEHCLVARPTTVLSEITEIACTHFAYLDCKDFVDTLKGVVRYSPDSSFATQLVSEVTNEKFAAIASEEAADAHGLSVLSREISSIKENKVRYLVIASKPHSFDLRIPCKTTVIFYTSNEPGALVDALTVFKENGITLIKIDSHPVSDSSSKELFYVDFQGNISHPLISSVMKDLENKSSYLRVLGSYPSFETQV